MPAMLRLSHSLNRPLLWAVLLSLLVHGLALFAPRPPQEIIASAPPGRIGAQLKVMPRARPPEPAPAAPSEPTPAPQASAPQVRSTTGKQQRRTLQSPQGSWSAAEKAEMDRFLDELAETAKQRPPPSTRERALRMAREIGREMAVQDEAGRALLELKPNAAPPDPFTLSLYVDGLIRRLNRSAAFVPRPAGELGKRPAAVRFKVNPDGSLRAFEVINAGDQAAQIAFIQAVVERSIPFARFPAELDKAANSLAMTVCIQPNAFGDGVGFRRLDSKSC